MLAKGESFPDFELKDHHGAAVTQEALKNKWTVVYFYMKNYSDICTNLAKEFNALARRFKSRGCQIFGVSADSPRSHSTVWAKHRLFQSLLSDPDHALMTATGVWGPKKMHGKDIFGARRTTFIVDPQGVVREAMTDVVTLNHPAHVLEVLTSLQKAEAAKP